MAAADGERLARNAARDQVDAGIVPQPTERTSSSWIGQSRTYLMRRRLLCVTFTTEGVSHSDSRSDLNPARDTPIAKPPQPVNSSTQLQIPRRSQSLARRSVGTKDGE